MAFVHYLLLCVVIAKVRGIWPPPLEIHLEDSETFVISEFSDDLLDDEDEMIPVRQTSDDKKYFKIHQLALKHNKRELEEKRKVTTNMRKVKERNFDMEEPIPWEGGFIDKHGNFIQLDNENVYYLNEMAKGIIDSKIERKREEEKGSEEKEENYDYKHFKDEYQETVKKAKDDKGTFNYTDVKEEETLGDAVETVVEFKKPKNCTAEEARGIGLSAMKCIVSDLKTSRSKNSILNLIEKILRITLIWLIVYALIAIPCWCTRGWCCCCCCCKICRPRETIDEAKQFYTRNPVGTFHTKDGKKIEYEPTNYEIYAQKRLERALYNL